MPVPSRVLDLFAVPDDPQPLPGGQGASVRAGDLVLSPGRDPEVLAWLGPALARLAVRLDEDPHRAARDLRVAVPVPARDGSWVVDGWAATRFEEGAEPCRDLEVTRRAGHLLHAHLAVAVPERPKGLAERADRWARAEGVAFGEAPLTVRGETGALARLILRALDDAEPDAAPEQVVHADLAGNVLLDRAGAPLVTDVSPAWRSPRWADAVCVLDSVRWHGTPTSSLAAWTSGAERAALLRAVVFRLLSDTPAGPAGVAGADGVAAYARIATSLL